MTSSAGIIYRIVLQCSVLLLLAHILPSCTKELKLPDSSKNKKIVLQGEFVVDSNIYLRASQTISLSTAGSKFELPSGLNITVTDAAGASYLLTSTPDSVSGSIFSLPYYTKEKITAGNTYTVTATHSSMVTATAVVHVPAPISARVTDTSTVIFGTDTLLKVNIEINDAGAETNYYVIEALKKPFLPTSRTVGDTVVYDTVYTSTYLRQALYTDDANAENAILTNISNRGNRVLYRDRSFNGKVLKTYVYIPKIYFPILSANNYFESTKSNILLLHIKSISEDYYTFLKDYDQYEPLSGFNTSNAPVKIDGNINNGFGMLGGVSAYTIQYRIHSY